ncbi:MAG: enoyl-CoA hydratase/isomerase family protein [Myxococcota bacterium]
MLIHLGLRPRSDLPKSLGMAGESGDLVVYETKNGVATLRMNKPERLNGWTMPMQKGLGEALARAAQDDGIGAVVLTGTGKYYSAGADLGGSFKLDHPRKLHAQIEAGNYELFDHFIQFPKPILAAVNGPAIGAPVTTGVLCDAILASDKATFLTPFAKVGVVPEGCSSVLWPRIYGDETAQRMLGPEGWRPTAAEAQAFGMVTKVVAHDQLMDEAQSTAEGWIAEGRTRTLPGGATKAELESINRDESKGVADAFLSSPFLMNQYRFFWSRKKHAPALTFLALRLSRPAWSLML